MIVIKQDIVEQLLRESCKDPRYLIRILKRMPELIRETIMVYRTALVTDLEAYTAFLFSMENGIEEFSIEETPPLNYLDEVERVNPDVHDYVHLCFYTKTNRFIVLVFLFRMYESEHEVRSLQ